MKRESILPRLKDSEPFDMLVVGGGATGCGVALDAASRGLSCSTAASATWKWPTSTSTRDSITW